MEKLDYNKFCFYKDFSKLCEDGKANILSPVRDFSL